MSEREADWKPEGDALELSREAAGQWIDMGWEAMDFKALGAEDEAFALAPERSAPASFRIDEGESGAAALLMAARAFGRLDGLRAAEVPAELAAIAAMESLEEAAAERYGLDARPLAGGGAALDAIAALTGAGHLVLAALGPGRWVLVTGTAARWVHYHDPATGAQGATPEAFAPAAAIAVMRPDDVPWS